MTTEAYLLDTKWAGLTPYGNNYTVWLKGYSKKEEGVYRNVKLTVELRSPQLIGEGSLLASKKIELSYNIDKDISEVSTTELNSIDSFVIL